MINILLLIPTTLNYSHKDRVEPLVFLSKQEDLKGVIFDCTEKDIFIPYSYLGFERPDVFKITNWEQLENLKNKGDFNYVVIFSEDKLEEHLENLKEYIGEVKVIKHINASLIDQTLHFLNPKHNKTEQVWVGRRVENK